MLQEAYRLYRSLQAAGVDLAPTAGDVRLPGKKTGSWAFVLLDPSGLPSEVRVIGAEDEPGLWTIMEGKKNSFPVVRFKHSLISLREKSPVWSELAEAGRKTNRDAAIASIVLRHADPDEATNPDPKLWRRLGTTKVRTVRTRAENASEVVGELCVRFAAGAGTHDQFFQVLCRCVLDQLRRGKSELAQFAWDLIFGKQAASGSHNTEVQLALDVAGVPSIYQSAIRRAMSAAKPAVQRAPERSACAFTGVCEDPLGTPYPQLRFPVLSQDYPLLSMFSDAHCNTRYGLSDYRIVPVSRSIVADAHKALAYAVDQSRKGYIWQELVSDQGPKKKKDLLIAFIQEGDEPERSSALVCASPSKRYQQETAAVIEALEGIAQKNPAASLDLFVIRGVSLGQAQVIYARRPLVGEVLAGAKAWLEGQRNLPATILSDPDGSSLMASPEDAVRLLSQVWKNDGSAPSRVHGISSRDALDLLLRTEHSQKVAEAILALATRRASPLLRKCAREKMVATYGTRNHRTATKTEKRLLGDAQMLTHLLALALFHLGHIKETYMTEPAYLTGCLFGVADKLHIKYCAVVREKDQLPPPIGNALLGKALSDPVSALAALADRMRIYIGWAKTVQVSGGEHEIDIKSAKKALRQCKEVAGALVGRLPNPRPTDAEKAQILLGYLASDQLSGSLPDVQVDVEEDDNDQ